MPNFVMRINSKPRQKTQQTQQTQPIQRQPIIQARQQSLILGSSGRRNCAALQFKGSKTCGSCGKR